jgi:hypothetical protein
LRVKEPPQPKGLGELLRCLRPGVVPLGHRHGELQMHVQPQAQPGPRRIDDRREQGLLGRHCGLADGGGGGLSRGCHEGSKQICFHQPTLGPVGQVPQPFMASNGGGPSRLQSAHLVAAVAELGSLARIAMRTLFLAFLLLPLATFADEVRIVVGMSREDTVALIKKHSGTDITPGLEVVGPNGEHPLTGIYWEFQDYDAIITLATKDGKISAMTFWSKKDFGESKSHRAKTEQSITALKIDTKKKEVSIEKKKSKLTIDLSLCIFV